MKRMVWCVIDRVWCYRKSSRCSAWTSLLKFFPSLIFAGYSVLTVCFLKVFRSSWLHFSTGLQSVVERTLFILSLFRFIQMRMSPLLKVPNRIEYFKTRVIFEMLGDQVFLGIRDEVVAILGLLLRRCWWLCCGCGHAAGFVSDATVMKQTSYVKAVITVEPHLSNRWLLWAVCEHVGLVTLLHLFLFTSLVLSFHRLQPSVCRYKSSLKSPYMKKSTRLSKMFSIFFTKHHLHDCRRASSLQLPVWGCVCVRCVT